MENNRFISYLRLTRIHSAVLTGLAPVCTAVAMMEPLPLVHYFALFIIGLFFHIYLFVCNEICDIRIDKELASLKQKPLVEKTVSLTDAKKIVLVSIIGVFLGAILLFPDKIIFLFPISIGALVFGGLYDRYGKYIPHADYFIASMMFFVALFGAYSVNSSPTIFAFVIAFLAFIQLLINNIIAGVKDVGHDFIQGGKSTVLRLGVRINENRLRFSKKIFVYIICLKAVQLLGIFIPFAYSVFMFQGWQLIFAGVLSAITIVFLIQLLRASSFKREYIMRIIGFHEMIIFMVIPVMLYSYIGIVGMVFLLIFPVVWLGFFLMVLYRRLMPTI